MGTYFSTTRHEMHPVPEIKITDQAAASLENQRNGVKNMYNFDEIIDRLAYKCHEHRRFP